MLTLINIASMQPKNKRAVGVSMCAVEADRVDCRRERGI